MNACNYCKRQPIADTSPLASPGGPEHYHLHQACVGRFYHAVEVAAEYQQAGLPGTSTTRPSEAPPTT